MLVTPFILAGAMSPVTTAAACGPDARRGDGRHGFVQLVRPGAPVILGSFASSISMQSGAPTFGTPEPALLLYAVAAAGAAARRAVPIRRQPVRLQDRRTPRLPTSRADTFKPTILAGINFVLHAAGWLEGGLSIGYEKFILDPDQCGMAATFRQGHGPLRERPGGRRDP